MIREELRIGNTVFDNGKEYDVRCGEDLDWLSFDPIPLTEEWLLKFGFDVIDDNPKQKDHYEGDIIFKILDFDFSNSVVTATVNERGFYSYQINEGKTIIFYVHQLQNLYFALTGEELTLKSND